MNVNSPNKDPLEELLQSWRVNVSLPPGFERNVWQRIDRTRPVPAQSIGEIIRNWIANALPRPALAATYVAALMVIGVGVGWSQAQQDSARLKGELGQRYVQVLDPYLSAP